MVQVITVGDPHVSDKAPVNATDSYTDDIIEMLVWIADEAKRREVDAVILLGDIFHHKAPSRNSHQLVQKMIDVVRYYEKVGVPLWAIVGNHDLTSDRMDSLPSQPLGVLFKAGLRRLEGWHPELPVYGIGWRQDWTTNEDAPSEAFESWRAALGLENDGDPGVLEGPALALTHAPVYPPREAAEKLFELVPCGGEKGLSSAMGNQGYFNFGHIHSNHGTWEVDGVTYANFGALSRGSLVEYNLERSIQVALWNPEVGFEAVDVPHKPASEHFKIEKAEEVKAEKLSLDAFLQEVGSSTLDVSSTGSVIQAIQTRPDVSPRVKKKAIEILESVE